MARSRWMVALVVLALAAAACGSGDDVVGSAEPSPETVDGATDSVGDTVSISNQGGSLEGHTPRGFAGFGTGLFAGDNLNPKFPNDDGVQIWLTFEISPDSPTPARAVLRSDAMSVSGSPFSELGTLRADPVSYDVFEPGMFDTASDGESTACGRVGDSGLECDVTAAVSAAFAAGHERVQFRLRFDTVADGDGQQDLALFFLTESNTNEPGIFTLDLS